MMNEIITEKKCTKCNKILPVTSFYKTGLSLYSHCKKCHKEYSQNWQKNNWKKVLDIAKKLYHANRGKNIERHKKWLLANKEKVRKQRQSNPKAVVYKQNRRARKYNNGGTFTAEEWRDVCNKYDNRCLRCGEHKPLAADHVTPVSKGGTSYIDNIQPLCKSCNSWKGTKTIDFR